MAPISAMFTQPEPCVRNWAIVRLGFARIENASSAIGSTRSARSAARANRYWSPRRTSTRTSNSCSFHTAIATATGIPSMVTNVAG